MGVCLASLDKRPVRIGNSLGFIITGNAKLDPTKEYHVEVWDENSTTNGDEE